MHACGSTDLDPAGCECLVWTVQVWQSVEQQRGPITACIDALAEGLQRAEQTYSQEMQATLQDMVAVMCDIAHLDEGRIQRLTEQESATLNLQVLENRYIRSGCAVIDSHPRKVSNWAQCCVAWLTH